MYYTYGEKAEITFNSIRNVLFSLVSGLFQSHFSALFLWKTHKMMLEPELCCITMDHLEVFAAAIVAAFQNREYDMA